MMLETRSHPVLLVFLYICKQALRPLREGPGGRTTYIIEWNFWVEELECLEEICKWSSRGERGGEMREDARERGTAEKWR